MRKMMRNIVSTASALMMLGLGEVLAQTAAPHCRGAVLNSGDTAWMLTSSLLVLMMLVPGLALFYGGMVRKKNVLAC